MGRSIGGAILWVTGECGRWLCGRTGAHQRLRDAASPGGDQLEQTEIDSKPDDDGEQAPSAQIAAEEEKEGGHREAKDAQAVKVPEGPSSRLTRAVRSSSVMVSARCQHASLQCNPVAPLGAGRTDPHGVTARAGQPGAERDERRHQQQPAQIGLEEAEHAVPDRRRNLPVEGVPGLVDERDAPQ